ALPILPGLSPRLALCGPGDRIYVGPRIVGRYTLAPVRDPEATVVFLATGTGEAPHNAMITELLRKGHHGPIVSVVCVRYRADLAYLEKHRRLEERFPNYHYMPLVTREPDVEKLYIQDVIERDLIAERFGVQLDPERTHVFLCGNAAIVGLPRWEGDTAVWPEAQGVCQLLTERGFQLDRQDADGNIHTQMYWWPAPSGCRGPAGPQDAVHPRVRLWLPGGHQEVRVSITRHPPQRLDGVVGEDPAELLAHMNDLP